MEILYTKEPESDYLDAALITVMQIHLNEPAGDIVCAMLWVFLLLLLVLCVVHVVCLEELAEVAGLSVLVAQERRRLRSQAPSLVNMLVAARIDSLQVHWVLVQPHPQ